MSTSSPRETTPGIHRATVPVIALTGHLGAGKTTLLNHLLRQPGARIGVVINDFGEINVDAGLVTGQIDDPASIAGGCLCCLEDAAGLDEALAKLTHPRLALDAVVVEASGIAEPGALAKMIRYSEVDRVRSGGVVDVVDALNYFETIDDGGVAPARFEIASLVVLNRCDQLDPTTRAETLDRIEARIRERNDRALVVRTSRGRIDPQLVYDVASADDPEDELPIAALLREAGPDPRHQHAHAVTSRGEGAVDADAIARLLEDPPTGVYRIKGTVAVNTDRGLRGFSVHLAGRSTHVSKQRIDTPVSELVAIGLELDADLVRERLEQALRPSAEPDARGLRRLLQHRA
ncbi:CobW family GTP-binding protein [Nocardioides alcanivorans]|uniref:CobW family GTP-binding protein n=1 Tax=Nocardioides alcanivorans TaxID=2897352 RepID=UPI001F26AAFA|nr:GTP-binding protein [Nocardioides alcanivorans]